MKNDFRERKSENSKQEIKGEVIKPNEAKKRLWKHFRQIQRLVKQKSYRYGLDHDVVLNLVLDELSKNDFSKIRAFEGRQQCTFKTFINTVVTNLVVGFFRKKKSRERTLEEVEPDVFVQGKCIEKFNQTIFDQEVKEPLEILLEIKESELLEKALTHLPKILKKLDKEEQRVIKMRFFKELKISTIARELNLSRHKVGRILENVKFKIKGQLDEILKRNKNPGNPGG
jgi:RNA polymerase sigma factor (sigma-70 family)